MEGFPTLLSRKIKYQNPELKKYIDANDEWFDDARRKHSSSEKSYKMIFVDDLILKYSQEEVIRFIKVTDRKKKFKDDTKTTDYYRFAASFCKHIANQIGLEKLIHLAKEELHYSRSIIKTLENQGFDVNDLYNSWIEKLYTG